VKPWLPVISTAIAESILAIWRFWPITGWRKDRELFKKESQYWKGGPAMKQFSSFGKNVSARVLLLSTALWVLNGDIHGQERTPDSAQQRRLQLRELMNTLEGSSSESLRVLKTPDGYVRNILAPPSTHFPVEPAARVTPEMASRGFLRSHAALFSTVSPRLEFGAPSTKRSAQRSFVRYQQKYAGLEVFGACVILQVHASGGIQAVTSDIMRDTALLDSNSVSLKPSIDVDGAQEEGMEFLAAEYKQLQFKAGPPILKIFSPSVVGLTGPTRLVWQTEVGNTGELQVKELVLIDAHNGDVAFHYSLIKYAKNREIDDYEGRTTNPVDKVREEGDPETGIGDVDDTYDYLEDTYDFFMTHHSRDSYDGGGALMEAWVRYGISDVRWLGTYMRIAQGEVTDDTVGHEFTHGVIGSSLSLVGYGDAGAIEESLCDAWGEWIDQTNGTGGGPDWYLFEDWDPTPWRRMDDPPQCTTDISYGTDFNNVPQPDRYDSNDYYRQGSPSFPQFNNQDDGGEHHNVGVGNKLCYLLTEGGSHNGHSVSGFDIAKTADLYYECIDKELLPPACDYYDLYFALIQAAINLDFSVADRVNIKEACEAVGVCPPEEEGDWELESHWRLDESGSATTASDAEGGNNGAIQGDPNWVSGKLSNAFSFNGATNSNYISLSSAVGALKGRSATVAAWIYPHTLSGYRPIVSQYYKDPNDNYHGYDLCIASGSLGFFLDDFGAWTSSIGSGAWHHVVGTCDGLALKIYVDGTLQDVNDNEDIAETSGVDTDAYIGHPYSPSNDYFDGLIDDVRVYNFALSEEEVADLAAYGEPMVFRVLNASAAPVALIDEQGNLFLKGTLTSGTPQASSNDEFRVKNQSNNDVAIIDMVTGNMVIAGTNHENQTDLSSATNFIIKTWQNAVVAYIDASGNLYLKGKVYPNWIF
jgi:hypothetical protein